MRSFKRVLFGAFVSLLLSSAAHSDLFEDVKKGNWEAVHKTFFKNLEDPRTQYQAFLRINEFEIDLYSHIVTHAPGPDSNAYEFFKEIIELYERLCIAFEPPKPQGLSLDNLQSEELKPRTTLFGLGGISESAPVMITRRRSDSTNVVKEITRDPRQAMQHTLESSLHSESTTAASTTATTPTKAQIFTSSLPTLVTSGLKPVREGSPLSVRSKFQRQRRSKSAEDRNKIISSDPSTADSDSSQTELSGKKSSSQELLRKVLGRRSKSAPEKSDAITQTEMITEIVVNSLGAITIAEPRDEFEPGELAAVDHKQNGDVQLHFQTETEDDQIILLPMEPEPLGSGRQGSVYKVKDISGKKPIDIALKIKASEDPEVAKQFVNEARVLGVIGSLIVYDICNLNLKTTHLLAMDLIPGEQLFKYFYDVKKLENGDLEYSRIYIDDKYLAAKMIVEVTMAVIWLHEFGIMHRDLKPENVIWIKEERTAKLCDYGYATLATLGEEGICTGSWGWKGPECTKEPIGVETHLSDLWGLGNIIFHILTRPGRGGNWMDFICNQVERNTPLDITHLQAEFFDAFSRIEGAERHKIVFDTYQDNVRKDKKKNPQAIYRIEDNPEAANARRNLAYPETQGLFLAQELTKDNERHRPSSKKLKIYVEKIKELSWERSHHDLKEIERKQIELKEPLKKELSKKIGTLDSRETSQNEIDGLLKEVKKSVSERPSKEKKVRTTRASSETVPKEKTRLVIPRKSSVSPRRNPKLSPKLSPNSINSRKDREPEDGSEV